LAVFGRSFWQGQATESLGQDVYYRPLVNFTLQLERRGLGESAGHFHLTNLLLHGLVTGLVVILLGVVTRSLWDAGCAGLLFGLHPLFGDNVAYVSGRTDLLALLGLLVAAIALVRAIERPAWFWVALVWLGSAEAMFSKESALLVSVVVAGWLLGTRGKHRNLKQAGVVFGGVAILNAVYFLARQAVLGAAAGMRIVRPTEYIALTLDSFGRLLGMFVFPWTAPMFIWEPGGLSRLTPWVVIGLLWLVAPVLFRRFDVRPFWMGWLWAGAFLLLVAGLVQFGPVGRLLYLAGPGLLLMAVALVQTWAQRRPEAGRIAAVGALVLGVMMVPFLWQRMRSWQNERVLFTRMTREAAGYAPGHYNLGTTLLAEKDTLGAIAEFGRALELDSTIVPANLNLGALLQVRGELALAAGLFSRAVRLRPDYAPAHANLGLVRFRQGDTASAIAELKEAVRLAPDDANVCYNLARMLELTGQKDAAKEWASRACRLQPDNRRFRALFHRLGTK